MLFGRSGQRRRRRRKKFGVIKVRPPDRYLISSNCLVGGTAIVYARAPPSFQTRYFQFRPHASGPSPIPTSALSLALSLSLGPSGGELLHSGSVSPSSRASPQPYTVGTVLRLQSSITPALFINELEYLYTGQGFGEAFEFLFDDPNGSEDQAAEDTAELRVDKLRKDFVYMWRSRLYSDVKISLTGSFSSNKEHENTTAVFSTHKFILVARSKYFRPLLLHQPQLGKSSDTDITLPSPPFTPASLHFTLGYLYTGTLAFSHRTYDLTTAFHIYLSSLPPHLNLPHLLNEIRARIVYELCHGLFHAYLDFPSYEALIKGRWALGGCRCRQCARRAPRVLEFATGSDIPGGDKYLDRGARRALVGLLGDGWVTAEWATLPQRLRDSVIKGVGKRCVPENGNVWGMLWAVEGALEGRLAKGEGAAKDKDKDGTWQETVRVDLKKARDLIDECLADRVIECFSPPPHNSNSNTREGDEESFISDWHEILLRASSSQNQHSSSGYQPSPRNHPRMHHNKLASIVSSLTYTPSDVSDVSFPINANSNSHHFNNSNNNTKSSLGLGNGTGLGVGRPPSLYTSSHQTSLILSSLLRGLKPSNAPLVYQTLVSNVLLLPAQQDPDQSLSVYDPPMGPPGYPGGGARGGGYPTGEDGYEGYGYGTDALLLPQTSHVRIQVEETRMEVLRWIRPRWKDVREKGGFVGFRWGENPYDTSGRKSMLVGSTGKSGVLKKEKSVGGSGEEDEDEDGDDDREGLMEGWALKEIADCEFCF